MALGIHPLGTHVQKIDININLIYLEYIRN